MTEVVLSENSSHFEWVEKALKSENVKIDQVFSEGTTARGQGYSGDVNFLTVEATKNGNPIKYHLVIKSSTQNENVRKSMPVRKAYEKEIYFYHTVLPEFQKFEVEKNLKPFDDIPKYFDGFLLEKQEVIIFENLRTCGYGMHEEEKPMNSHFRKLTLEAYAHWHALNFALRDQKPDLYTKICNTSCSVLTDLAIKADGFVMHLQANYQLMLEILKQRGEFIVMKKYQKKFEKGFKTVFSELLTESENDENSVYIHGDCWTNNFMFRYEEDDKFKSHPSKVALLDFQLSGMNSPAVDLSYHLYSATPENEIENITEQLQFYHKCLSKKMNDLGSDATKIFPFSTLVEQWKKYSLVGVIMTLCALPQGFLDTESKPNVEDFIVENTSTSLLDKMKPDAREVLFDRLVSIVRHNVKFDTSY